MQDYRMAFAVLLEKYPEWHKQGEACLISFGKQSAARTSQKAQSTGWTAPLALGWMRVCPWASPSSGAGHPRIHLAPRQAYSCWRGRRWRPLSSRRACGS